ncbi:MAG TPA: hypothetical protein P5077_09500 [bacterium]|nr:hypothetical protein [bacterium]
MVVLCFFLTSVSAGGTNRLEVLFAESAATGFVPVFVVGKSPFRQGFAGGIGWRSRMVRKVSKPKKVAKTNLPSPIEEQKLPDVIVKEEVYNLLDDQTVVPIEFNIAELPFFTKNDRIEENVSKKYTFAKNSYMQVFPSHDEKSGKKILQDFDEKIFYAILMLYRKQGKEIVTNAFELLRLAGIEYKGGIYDRVHESMYRMKGCQIRFSNSLYSAEARSLMKNERVISILQDVQIWTLEKLQDEGKPQRDKYEKYFNGRLKEIIVIRLSDFIATNIEHKGYLSYDADKLVQINNATARKIYIMIKKWQGWEKKKTIERTCRFIASRIPLSWEKKNLSGTIRVIERSCEELKQKKFIEDFVLKKEKPIEESTLIFIFPDTMSARERAIEAHNTALVTTTGQEHFQIQEVEEQQTNLFELVGKSTDDVKELLSLIPSQVQTVAMRQEIESAFEKRGYDYVESNIRYALMNATENVGAYMVKALREDYGSTLRLAIDAEREKQKTHREDIRKQKEEQAEKDRVAKRREQLKRFYESLTADDQRSIWELAEKKARKAGASEKMLKIAVETTYLMSAIEEYLLSQ